MYSFVIVALTCLGLLAGLYFCLSWFPKTYLAKRRGATVLSWREVLDFAAPPAGITALYVLAVWNMITTGVQPAPTLGIKVARILTTVIFDLIVLSRAERWYNKLRDEDGESPAFVPKQRPSSDHTYALEGTDEHDPGSTQS